MPLPKQNLAHPCFPQPDSKIPVWRYMDLVKLASLLTSGELVLSRIDAMQDKFEGRYGMRYTQLLKEERLRFLESLRVKLGLAADDPFLKVVAESGPALDARIERLHAAISYVSCWRAGPEESEAMWRIYGATGASVAMKLPYERLRDSLSDPALFIGSVTYYNRRKDLGPGGNVLRPLMWKRGEFRYEEEVRILKWDTSLIVVPPGGGLAPKEDRPRVLGIPWSPADHVESILISPYAAGWEAKAIRATVAWLCPGLEDRVIQSEMSSD